MGIRFFCPNGHKLNVKVELAGKVGICPKCGAKMLIPLESTRQPSEKRSTLREGAANTSQVSTDEVLTPTNREAFPKQEIIAAPFTNPKDESSEEFIEHEHVAIPTREESASGKPEVRPSGPPPVPPKAPGNSNSLLQDPNVLWYIRSLEGQQYGPITGTVVQDWMKEKRIGPTMLVWREGWSTWLEAKNVFPELESIFMQEVKREEVPEFPAPSRPTIAIEPEEDTTLTIQKKTARKKKAGRDLTIVIILIVLILCLIAGLVAILMMQSSPGKPAENTPGPATVAPAPAPPASAVPSPAPAVQSGDKAATPDKTTEKVPEKSL